MAKDTRGRIERGLDTFEKIFDSATKRTDHLGR